MRSRRVAARWGYALFCRGEHCSSVCLACRRTSVILRFSIKKTEESRKRQHSRLRLMFAPNFFVGECYLCPCKSWACSYRLGRVLRPRRSTRLAFIGSLGMTLVRCVDNSRIASPCLPRRGRGTTKWWKESPPHCGSRITDLSPLSASREEPVPTRKRVQGGLPHGTATLELVGEELAPTVGENSLRHLAGSATPPSTREARGVRFQGGLPYCLLKV